MLNNETYSGLQIVYTYELVMRMIASLWFPETRIMTRRKAEGHSSRRGELYLYESSVTLTFLTFDCDVRYRRLNEVI